MSSFPKPIIEVPETELDEKSKKERDELLANGYQLKHLLLLEDGSVVFDPELSDYDAFTQVFQS